MKRVIVSLICAAAVLVAPQAQAQTASGTFNVNITLTSVCTLSAIGDVNFTYTSLQAGVSNATGGAYTVSCTNSLPYTFGLQAGTGALTPPFSPTISVSDNFVNLSYQLGTSAAGGTGNGAAQPYSITGTMAAGQGGTCGAASCNNGSATNRTHTLVVQY
ncbi:MAG TPA: spore coat protein U domain-containing protein [Burkholderiales bacterium]|nr:spore coat protein U domain-containing protein [Burkholderiales bacterium]